ncbi:MAG: Uma2 family endonuclease [Fimbriiglobus sp.]|jgi:Uma2 family endonuclease|nr:Uma2 family endonuclease [Fimbriiglobus sp.]
MTPKTAKLPPLENGDRLTADDFHARYAAMPHIKKAELIDGEVFMPSPTKWIGHGTPHLDLGWFLKHYTVFTPGTTAGDNATVRLDLDNEPQPDVTMIIDPDCGGQAEVDADDYLSGAPELVAEVSGTSAGIDLNRKFDVYRRNRVREYVVHRTHDGELDWFVLRRGRFTPLAADPADGLLKSETFPGLWLDAAALVRGELPAVLSALTRGLQSAEHATFVKTLAKRRR